MYGGKTDPDLPFGGTERGYCLLLVWINTGEMVQQPVSRQGVLVSQDGKLP